MPEPIASDRRYLPGLDGLRAIAVIVVILYHLNLGWASGGLLGVGVFFTLSGYLITDLLLGQRAAGRLSLRRFWLARARRLLPALFLMLVVVSIWTAIHDPSQLSVVRGQVLAALVYMSNWWQSFQNLSYFQRFGAPSPLNHLWSLSVEEQFYVVWPWLLLAGIAVVREHPKASGLRPRLAGLTLLLAAASAIEMAVLYTPSFDPSRVYYGTDTRAFGLLLGAALAMMWPSRSLRADVGARAGDVLDVVGVIGIGGILVMVWRTTEYSSFIYQGGLVLLSVFTMMALLALTHPAARLGRVLGWTPLRWIGVRSYAIYLWHVPIIILTTPAAVHGSQPVRAIFQVALTLVLSALSWTFLENPIRHGALGRAVAELRDTRWQGATRSLRYAVTGLALVLTLTVVALSGAFGGRSPGAEAMVGPGVTAPHGVPRTSGARHPRTGTVTEARPAAGHAGARGLDRPPPGTAGPMTACRQVVHFGDSTSEGMVSDDYLPDSSQQLPAQLAAAGVRKSIMEITGGTSIIETLPGDINAYTTAQQLAATGFDGCWIIALGTNDAADIAVGSSVSLAERVSMMMSVIRDQAVLWETTRTLLGSGPYANSGMQQWNETIEQACRRYPNMRVWDWASAIQDRWFIPDGIHFYSPGYAARARLTAEALAKAFPAGAKRPKSCVIDTGTANVPVLGTGP